MALTAAQLLVRVGADTSDAEAGLNKIGRSITSMAGSMAGTLGRAGAGMTAAFTLPLVALGTQALSTAADFEQSMNILAAVTSTPAAAMEALTQQALELGAQTSFSAGEAAEAMLELGKAGMDAAEIGDSIAGVMDLAAAGGIGLAEAATVTSAALNTFQLDASESARIANLLAGAANASAADMNDLALSMTQAGPGFALTNQSIEDMTTSIALLANVGQSGSKAGTNLNRAMQSLIRPTDKARKLMDKLGIDVFDASGEMLDMTGIIAEFNTALAGMTTEQRAAALSTILMGEGVDAMVPLLDAGVEGFTEMREQVTAQGQAATTAAARMSGLSGAMEYLKGSVDSFLIGAALPFLDFVGQIARGVADLISSFGTLPAPVRNAALAFAGVLAAAGPIIGVLAAVAGAFALLGTAAAPILAVTAAVAGLAAGIAYLASLGTIDLSAVWQRVQTAIQGALDTFNAWRTQIQTQGFISEETFIAAWELPAGWRDILQFLIGVGAAFKTISAAVTGTDLGAGRLRELNTILQSAFGSEIATRIENIAGHITELKEALSGATSVGDWLRSLSTFSANVGVEIKAIGVEVKKQIEAEIIKLNIAGLWQEVQVQFDAIPWHTIDINTAALIDAVAAQLGKGDWQPAGERAGKAVVEPFKTGVFAGFAAAVASEGWEPEQPLWDKALGNLNRIFWTRIGEFFSGMLEGVGIQLPEHKLLSEKAAKIWQESGNIPLAAMHEAGARISKAFSDLGQVFVDAAEAFAGKASAAQTWMDETIRSILGVPTASQQSLDLLRNLARTPAPLAADFIESFDPANWPPIELPAVPKIDPTKVQAIVDALAPVTLPVDLRPLQGPHAKLPEFPLPQLQWPTMEEMMRQIKTRAAAAGGVSTVGGDIPLKAMITSVEPAAGLKPLQISAMVTEMAEAGTGAGAALSKGASAIASSLSGFSWPPLPSWVWPALPTFFWPSYPTWVWPPIPAPSWLDRLVVPRPTWIGELLSWSPQVVVRQQAVTTPGQITTASAGEGRVGTAAMSAGGGVTITGDVYVRDELDLEQLAYRITQLQNRRG